MHHGAKAGEIEPRISQLAEWINLPHDDIDAGSYLHPLIKSIALHFCIGFIRPLGSKNGCLARALFYWCMYRHGYDAFRYISLSEMLLKNKSQYWRSFISTEDDHLDLTYFAEHQCEILVQAIADFVGFRVELEKFSPLNSELPFDIPKTSQGRSSSDNDNTKAESEVGLDVEVAEQAKETVPADVDLSTLSDQALSVIELAKSREDSDLTAKLVAEQCSVTEAVARAILNELTDKSLFSRERVKRQYVYSLLDN
ncbi:hypothetical protein A8L45_19145 [Veronia pacifica]|uniref:Fido domain-containing protein n=1 Tax=Veronia pacifica TaxID=1080227 RepID=A0A1C3EC68_9GAMM|nr:hypothetical protein A8L45_19145 [Veronia pacifica]